MKLFILSLFTLLFNTVSIAQSPRTIIQIFLEEASFEPKLSPSDISNWSITNMHTSSTSKVTHVYIQQTHQGIPVSNGLANFSIKDKKVLCMGNRLVANLNQKATTTHPIITSKQAIQHAAQQLQIEAPNELKILENPNKLQFTYNKGNISQESIPVRLMYSATSKTELKLVWDLSIYTLDSKHWWSVQIDAQNGDLLNKKDWVLSCNFNHKTSSTCSHSKRETFINKTYPKTQKKLAQPDQYTVFALPIESPNHGNRSIVSNPANSLASPYGWHDTNAVAGAEYTITRGNNVYAYEDVDSNNLVGFSPDGSSLLEFNFPYNSSTNPNLYQSAAITNLFYMNNMMHDIWYQYGFDEASGNFQNNNYGRGGVAGDEVFAEAQDSANMNNATFAVLPDGFNPRMQLFLWNSSGSSLGNFLDINTPSNITGSYTSSDATFGPGLPSTPITADLVLVEDNNPPINDACGTVVNSAALFGKIALIDLGNCNLSFKVKAVQDAGAIAAIIINNVAGPPSQMLGTDTSISIPSIMISLNDGNTIKTQLGTSNVNATISNGGGTTLLRDSDLDNGIIAHEYGHGISQRLTGGASTTGCLDNPEQMGEGWSDWFALMLTIEPGDLGTDARGIGTYVSNQPITGQGLRPAPYSTDFAVNSFTYGASNNDSQISKPHGIGFIFATVLWDLNWALIDFYGGTPDPDLYNGTGGNNVAMYLVIEALKMQPCSPGMIDGRDAILNADTALYGGIHGCLIWSVFANRGFGVYADQGSSSNRLDQTEDFNLPLQCQAPVSPPVAGFNKNIPSCKPNISFFDISTDVPQSWFWDFGDGNTSTLQNPVHTYNSNGSYIVQLVVSNSQGSDTTTQQIILNNLPPSPLTNNMELCLGDTAYIPTIAMGNVYWRDTADRLIYIGDTLVVPNVGSTQTYYLNNNTFPLFRSVGRTNNNGFGVYHSSPYHGALNFTAHQGFEISSTKVYADGAGPRTFFLANGTNNDGVPPSGNMIVDQVTVNLVDGVQTINLNLIVPEAGNYNIGGHNVDLYRNSSGNNYPYVLNNYISIDSSSAGDRYYYFYDLKITDPLCVSPPDTVLISPVLSAFSSFDNGSGSFSFSDASTSANSWFWDFGDNTTSTQQNPTHIYSSSGNYEVSLTINNGACSSTQTVSVVLGLLPVITSKPEIKLLPNPTNGLTQLVLSSAFHEKLEIQVTDINGKQIKQLYIPKGQTSLNLDVSKFPAAVYLVHIKGNRFIDVRKLIVE